MNDEVLYQMAAEELASGQARKGLLAKVFAAAVGGDAKTKAMYIAARVPQLLDELKQEADLKEVQKRAEAKRQFERRAENERQAREAEKLRRDEVAKAKEVERVQNEEAKMSAEVLDERRREKLRRQEEIDDIEAVRSDSKRVRGFPGLFRGSWLIGLALKSMSLIRLDQSTEMSLSSR